MPSGGTRHFLQSGKWQTFKLGDGAAAVWHQPRELSTFELSPSRRARHFPPGGKWQTTRLIEEGAAVWHKPRELSTFRFFLTGATNHQEHAGNFDQPTLFFRMFSARLPASALPLETALDWRPGPVRSIIRPLKTSSRPGGGWFSVALCGIRRIGAQRCTRVIRGAGNGHGRDLGHEAAPPLRSNRIRARFLPGASVSIRKAFAPEFGDREAGHIARLPDFTAIR